MRFFKPEWTRCRRRGRGDNNNNVSRVSTSCRWLMEYRDCHAIARNSRGVKASGSAIEIIIMIMTTIMFVLGKIRKEKKPKNRTSNTLRAAIYDTYKTIGRKPPVSFYRFPKISFTQFDFRPKRKTSGTAVPENPTRSVFPCCRYYYFLHCSRQNRWHVFFFFFFYKRVKAATKIVYCKTGRTRVVWKTRYFLNRSQWEYGGIEPPGTDAFFRIAVIHEFCERKPINSVD